MARRPPGVVWVMRQTWCRILAAGVLSLSVAASNGRAETGEWLAPEEVFPLGIDSGIAANASDEPACVFAMPIHVPGANWLRVVFEEATLPSSPSGERAFLRITSALDGAEQILDRDALRQWARTSAYFNGDTVLVELIAPAGVSGCRVVIAEARRDTESGGPRNTCGPTDDRMASNDPRSARLLPVGCTGWLIRDVNYCFLSAGHCAGSGLQTVQFNVPLSTASGAIQHPPPSDQYAVDPASLQVVTGGISIGNDWAYFGVFDNSTTGRTPFESQGDAFTLTTTPTVAMGQILRKTGFGTVTTPVSPTLNQAQKTLAGPIVAAEGTFLRYQIDSSGGDSGSPVFDESSGIAVAIHTNGGCTSAGGFNSGCSVLHPGLQAALASPTGVCIPKYFDITYPIGRPGFVQSIGGTGMRVSIDGRNGYVVDPTRLQLHYDAGQGFQRSQLEPTGGDLYFAHFPPIPCGTPVRYYISAGPPGGGEQLDPPDAPSHLYYTISASGVTTIASFDFETQGGWTVSNVNVTGGAWERGTPAGDGSRGDPRTDFDGSGQCYLTGNGPGDTDVDGGPTRLWSPAFNLAAVTRPYISYARWFTNDNMDSDRLEVEISNNFGASWSSVESVSHTVGWVMQYVNVASLVTPTNLVRIRFAVADEPNNSLTEAAVDAVTVFDLVCPAPGACRKGDVNQDGKIDGGDLQAFTTFLTVGGDPGSAGYCASDVNGSGGVDFDDVPLMINCIMLGGCP
mgnify:CR=1 FL=1